MRASCRTWAGSDVRSGTPRPAGLRHPPPDLFTVPLVSVPELPAQGRLLYRQDEQVEEEGDYRAVAEDESGFKKQSPARDHRQHPEAHRVTDGAVEPPHDQPPRRVNRGGRAPAERGEVPQAPEVEGAPGDEWQQRGRLRHAPPERRPRATRREAERDVDGDRARHDHGEQQVLQEEKHNFLTPPARRPHYTGPGRRHSRQSETAMKRVLSGRRAG